MYSNALLGVWPYIFQDNPTLRKLYNIYSKFTFYYLILFLLSAYIELFILMADDENRIKEIVANLCVTLLYTITAMRVSAMKSTQIKCLIKEILNTEEGILNLKDEEIISIYRIHAKQNRVTNSIYILNIGIETLFYFLYPLSVEDQVRFNTFTNETTVIKALPLSSWFPFDPQEYHLMSYLWHVLDGSIGASYLMYIDVFTFSLIIFPLGQIRILIHVLSNFQRYVTQVKNQLGCDRDEASFITLRECILKHKDIIRYIEVYNNSMKNIMVLDFMQSSLQLASVVLQLLVTELNIYSLILCGEFILCMMIRLLVYYWYGNEIMLESMNVATAIFECNWYEEPEKVKQMMSFMILRSNKALGLDIGPFDKMTLRRFLGVFSPVENLANEVGVIISLLPSPCSSENEIIKATYSYMMVMYR